MDRQSNDAGGSIQPDIRARHPHHSYMRRPLVSLFLLLLEKTIHVLDHQLREVLSPPHGYSRLPRHREMLLPNAYIQAAIRRHLLHRSGG